MTFPRAEETGDPQRVILNDEDLAAIDPMHALAWSEPNQLWASEGMLVSFSPAEISGLWTATMNFAPGNLSLISKRLRELLSAFWLSEKPDYVMTDVFEWPGVINALKDAGFTPVGALPLSSGNRILLGWRMSQ